MQYLTDNSYLNIKASLAFEDDRLILAQEQKASRARARKLSLETNRRRKVLEERRKAVELREQKLKDEILQQRRQRQQDATERYQRAHLPPSQRKRPDFRRTNHHLDEALKKIQGTFSVYALQPPCYSSSSSANRSYLSSPNSSVAFNKLRHQRQVSAAVAYAKLLQEKSNNNLKNSQPLFPSDLQEMERHLEDSHMSSMQHGGEEFVVREMTASNFSPELHLPGPAERSSTQTQELQEISQPGQTESLSSLDSADSENSQNASTTSAGCSTSSTLHHSELSSCTGSQPLLKDFYGVYPKPEMTFCRKESVIHNLWTHLKGASLSSEPSVPRRKEDSRDTDQPQHKILQAIGEVSTENQNSVTAALSILSGQSMSAQSRNAGNLTHHLNYSKKDQQSSLHEKGLIAVPCSVWANPVTTPTEKVGLTPGEKLDTRQTRNIIDRCSNQVSVTQIALPTNNEVFSNHSFKGPGCPQNTINQSISESEGTFMTLTEPENTSHLHKSQLNVNINTDCNKHENCKFKDERSRIADSSNPAAYKGDFREVSITQCSQCPVQGSQKIPTMPVSVFSPRNITSIKGILKKQSKYDPGHAKHILSYESVSLTNHVAVSIKNNMDLAKLKEKEQESCSTNKKKLRWFDEEYLNIENEDRRTFQEPSKQTQGMTRPVHSTQLQHLSAEHQKDPSYTGHLTATSVASRRVQAAQVMAPITSTGYHFTKQAWTDMRSPNGKLQEHRGEHRVEIPSCHRGGPRTLRRVSSARVSRGPASKSRKGALIRPQSATEGSQMTRTQGRVIVPRPPSKTCKSQGNTDRTSLTLTKASHKDTVSDCRAGLPVEHALFKDISGGCAAPQPLSIRVSGGVTFTPFPPPCTVSSVENDPKAINISSQQDSVGSSMQKVLVDGETGLCADNTHTDDEIYQLWHNVTDTFAHKDSHAAFHNCVSA